MHRMALYPFGIQIALSDQTRHAQNPTLHLHHCVLRWRQFGFQERGKTAIPVSTRQPGSRAIGVVLVSPIALFEGAAGLG